MTRIIIADMDPYFVKEISAYINKTGSIQVIGSCSDGFELCRMADQMHPDAILTEIVLQGMDGISAMKALEVSGSDAAVIVCTDFYNEVTIRRARKYGASAFLCKPVFPDSVVDAIIESCCAAKGGITRDELLKDIERNAACSGSISEKMISLGISQDCEGFRYLRDAVELVRNNPDMIASMTKQLYPELARLNSTTPARAERNIRTAIMKAYRSGGFRINGRKPTNKEMIAYLSGDEAS